MYSKMTVAGVFLFSMSAIGSPAVPFEPTNDPLPNPIATCTYIDQSLDFISISVDDRGQMQAEINPIYKQPTKFFRYRGLEASVDSESIHVRGKVQLPGDAADFDLNLPRHQRSTRDILEGEADCLAQ